MAVVLMEGFDHHSTSTITNKGWSSTPNAMGTGRLGGSSFQRSNAGSVFAATKALPSSYSTLFAGFAFKTSLATPSSARIIFELRAGGTETFKVVLNTLGKIEIQNSGGTVVVTSTTVLVAGNWYYIEVKAVIAGASGTATLRINGTTEAGPTTGNFGSTNLNGVTLYQPANAGLTVDWDDLYVCDTSGSAPNNDFLGDVRVETLLPNGDGNSTAWTASAGSDYTCVDESTPNGDTDYISSATPGDRDTFTFPDLAVSSGSVFAVQVNNYARKDDAGARTIAPVVRHSGTDYDGTTTAGLSTSYLGYSQIYNQDPTASDWTVSNVNAAEFGVKMVA